MLKLQMVLPSAYKLIPSIHLNIWESHSIHLDHDLKTQEYLSIQAILKKAYTINQFDMYSFISQSWCAFWQKNDMLLKWCIVKSTSEPKPHRKAYHLKDTALVWDFLILLVRDPMIYFNEWVYSISRKTISYFCQKAHHGCQWIGKHIIVVYSACLVLKILPVNLVVFLLMLSVK